MKKSILLILTVLGFSQMANAQIEVLPQTVGLGAINARIYSNQKTMSIGTDGTDFSMLPVGTSATKNMGMGTVFSSGIFGVPTFYNDGKLTIKHNSSIANNTGTAGPQLILEEATATDFARLRFRQSFITTSGFPLSTSTYNRGARFWDIAGFANGANTSEDKLNFYNSALGNIITIRGDGKVGILNDDPTLPFHVNSEAFSNSSSTGAVAIGLLTGPHLTFDSNEINAYNNIGGASLILNDDSAGDVLIGSTTNSDLVVSGFTNLGTSAPKIKMKKLTGTSASTQGGIVDIAHGLLSSAKILSVDIAIEASTNTWVPENYNGSLGYEFDYYYNNNNIVVWNKALNSNFILSDPIKIIVTYEE